MFRLPIAPAFRPSAATRTHPLISTPKTLPSPPQCSSRPLSTTSRRKLAPKLPALTPRTLPRPDPYIPPRPFANHGPRYYSNGNRYRRFDGAQGESIAMRLVRNAKPVHFVMIGGVVGGVYVYNTETVEVCTVLR
jgi:hypothetical protein